MSWISDVREEIADLDLSAKNLRKFPPTVGGVFLLVAVWFTWRHHSTLAPYLAALSVAFIVAGLVAPLSFRLAYQVWMGVSFGIGWFVSRCIIGLLFFLILTPIGILMRATGKDPLDMNGRRNSYWKARDNRKAVNYEKLF
jgi:hypothetical protein